MITRKLAWIVLLLAAVLGLTALRGYLQKADEQEEATSSRQYAPSAPEDHPALLWYREQFPDSNILLACSADFNVDERDDLVVIFQGADDNVQAVVLMAQEDGTYEVTTPIPAPQQHQKIRFFNMDKGAELEFLITGDKNGAVGYAVYRVEDGAIVNLFGEGMEDCC